MINERNPMATMETYESGAGESCRKLILLQCESFHEVESTLQGRIDGTFVSLVLADFGDCPIEELVEWANKLIDLGSR